MIRALVLLLFALAGIVPAAAQSAAEREACMPDAMSLCGSCVARAIAARLAGGKVDRGCFYGCFRAHRRELSAACDAVMKRHGH